MEWSQRVITRLPLQSLWDDGGPIEAVWSRDLNVALLRELLQQGPVRFMVANVGSKPRWVPQADCFDFWKGEVRPHLADPDRGAYLERFPGEYCYFAAEWQRTGGSPIVVLTHAH